MAIAFTNSKNLSATQDLHKIKILKFHNKWGGAPNTPSINNEPLAVIDSEGAKYYYMGWVYIGPLPMI